MDDLDELEKVAHEAISSLAARPDATAFHALLRLSEHLGQSIGASARSVAAAHSWAAVADATGTTRQAVWSRWNG